MNKSSVITFLIATAALCVSIIGGIQLFQSGASAQSEHSTAAAPSSLTINRLTMVVGEQRQVFSSFLARDIARGLFRLDDLEQLSFSISGDSDFGSNPAMEFFNSNGGLLPGNPDRKYIISPDDMEYMTGERNARPLFNLRRTSSATKGTVDTLYMIIPNMKEEVCRRSFSYFKSEGATTPIQDADLTIAPDNHHVVLDPPTSKRFHGCIKLANGHINLFFPLISRFQQNGSNTWQTTR